MQTRFMGQNTNNHMKERVDEPYGYQGEETYDHLDDPGCNHRYISVVSGSRLCDVALGIIVASKKTRTKHVAPPGLSVPNS